MIWKTTSPDICWCHQFVSNWVSGVGCYQQGLLSSRCIATQRSLDLCLKSVFSILNKRHGRLRQHHCQTIYPIENLIPMNLFKILCVVTWAWSFLTSEVVEAVRDIICWRTLWHFNSTFPQCQFCLAKIHQEMRSVMTVSLRSASISQNLEPSLQGLISSNFISVPTFCCHFQLPDQKWCICATWGLTWKNSATYLSRNDVLLVIFSPLNNALHPQTL